MKYHQSNRKTCRRTKTRGENAFPTRRLTPKWQATNTTERHAPEGIPLKKTPSNRKADTQKEITSQRGRLARERRLIQKTSSQQEDRHPKRKSRTQQKDLPQKEDSLRKCLANRTTDTQMASHEPNRKTCPERILLKKTPSQQEG